MMQAAPYVKNLTHKWIRNRDNELIHLGMIESEYSWQINPDVAQSAERKNLSDFMRGNDVAPVRGDAPGSLRSAQAHRA